LAFDKLNKKLEECIIEGLKIKGFEFEKRSELEEFIKSNCRCKDRPELKERVYFVQDVPFLLYLYHVDTDLDEIISMNYGNEALTCTNVEQRIS